MEQDSLASRYASDKLKQDREFWLAAVKINGLALKYVAPEWENDLEIVLAALQQDIAAKEYVSDSLRTALLIKDQGKVPEAVLGSVMGFMFGGGDVVNLEGKDEQIINEIYGLLYPENSQSQNFGPK